MQSTVPDDSKFCFQCGATAPGQSAPAPAADPAGGAAYPSLTNLSRAQCGSKNLQPMREEGSGGTIRFRFNRKMQ